MGKKNKKNKKNKKTTGALSSDSDEVFKLMMNPPSHIEMNGKHYCDAHSPNEDNINYECINKTPKKTDIKQINKNFKFNIPDKPTALPNGKIYCLTVGSSEKWKCADKREEDEDSVTTPTIEKFVGNNIIEGINGENSNKIYINNFLKAILFALVYFVIMHKNTRDFLIKKIKIDKNNYISMAIILFIVIYFVVNLFIS